MAKKMCNLNLDEDVIAEMDSLAEKMGMSRSQVGNQILGASLGITKTSDVWKTMFTSALDFSKSKRGTKTEGKKTAKIGA